MSTAPALPSTAIDAAVSTERRNLADHVAGLSEEQWSTQSLCEAWTVRHVVAHLGTTTRVTVRHLIGAAVKARGSFDRMEVDLAAARVAAYADMELVAQLRESADSTKRMPLSGPMDPLMDIVIHAQDIARPLGTDYVSPPEVVAACLAYVAGNKLMGGPKRVAGVRLVSSDTGWSLGDGPEVRGPDIDLLLTAAGRPAGLKALGGPGTRVIAARLP